VNVSAINGMRSASLLVDEAGVKIANMSATPDADLAAQITSLILASVAYDANARVLQTQDEVAGTAIDVLA